ncbi:uncharacterized protein G2W53_000540 [Senna tora]|uniref:Uncharacterized protein n=1 Tax=Senna tora TaxID=362788 RepID=A0A834XFR8_9FABA|nr:uncharacterized protein G2W53_000540 [Senna tora]
MDSHAGDLKVEELEIVDSALVVHDCKKKLKRVSDNATREKLARRSILSATKPSHTLRLGPNNLRSEHRIRLRNILCRLVDQQNWEEASGVLSVYLQATVNDRSPSENQFKYSTLLELLKHVENNHNNPTRIKNIYDVWMRKNGPMKDWPAETRFAVHLEFILFCIKQGNVEEAHQAVLCLKQESGSDCDPMSNMVMGMAFYELWYSCIPKEFQWRNSDRSDSPGTSHLVGNKFSNPLGYSEWHNTVESHIGETMYKCDSDTSVLMDKKTSKNDGVDKGILVPMEVDVNDQREKSLPNFQPQGFYLDSEEHTGTGDSHINHKIHVQDVASLYALERLDSWLLPLHLPDHDSFVEFISMHKELLNDHYKDAVKHLHLALDLIPSVSAALVPLVQLLLMGGQVDEALSRLEKQCCRLSADALPFRLKAAVLEHFGSNNSLLTASYYEDTLNKDPTCSDSLAKLVKMYQNGDYSVKSLIEMIGLHLDATYAESNTWRMFALCFFVLSNNEEDGIFTRPSDNEDGHKEHHSSFYKYTPKMFTEGVLGKAWKLRCRWWLTRHFSHNMLKSEIEAGDKQLLTYKAASASYMYGKEFQYVVKAYSHLQKENDEDLICFLNKHKHNSQVLFGSFILRHYDLVKGHLLKLSGREIKACTGISPSKLEELKKLDCEATLKEERSKARNAPLPPISSQSYERKDENEESSFYAVVHGILIEHWMKSSTPLDCLAHSLNPRYYSYDWLSKDPRRVPPHQDSKLTVERIKCLKRYFPNSEDRRKVNIEFANFSDGREGFEDIDSLNDRSAMDAKTWWLVHGVHAPILQKIALKLLR